MYKCECITNILFCNWADKTKEKQENRKQIVNVSTSKMTHMTHLLLWFRLKKSFHGETTVTIGRREDVSVCSVKAI